MFRKLGFRVGRDEYKGWKVPEVLLSGHLARIAAWKQEQAMERTLRLRPGLLKGLE